MYDKFTRLLLQFREQQILYIPSKIIAIYIIIGSLWILFSDKLLMAFTKDYDTISSISVMKGWLYVLVTAVLGFRLIKDGIGQVGKAERIRKENEEKIKYLAFYDKLTGLPNKSSLEADLDEWISSKHPDSHITAVLLIDPDNFKVINDLFSHSFGDKMLKDVGEVLKQSFSDKGKVYRLEGDVFALMIAGAKNTAEVADMALRINAIFEKPWNFDKQNIYTPVRIGISILSDHGDNAGTLVANANMALLQAKENKQESFCIFKHEYNDIFIKKLELYSELKKAITNEEFVVYYQPQVEAGSFRITGFEALVRWQHPTRGLVLPGDFIEIAEETGLIVSINEIVMREACAKIKEWNKKYHDTLHISVNFSVMHFQQRDFDKQVIRLLEEIGLHPEFLEVEITETCAMKNIKHAVGLLSELKKTGVTIVLDDFGKGYSSLNYLTRLPIDTVKIDKSFVNNITLDNYRQYVAEVIINLAHRQKMKVIAEGIENGPQFEYLKDIGCDVLQGYLFSRPIPALEAEKLLREGIDFKQASKQASS